jgi:hypothetical protein
MSEKGRPRVPHSTRQCRCDHYDPIREIDLILLEDVMLRYKTETTTTAIACRTGAMIVILLAVAGMLAHSVIAGGRQMTAAAKAPQLERGYTP